MEKFSFYSLLKNYIIEIPIIQRDYAQGRTSEKIIAKNFVEAIREAITNNQPLSLDFIYGRIDEKKDHTILVPLDGQQRLTTLFLLHYYIACKENKSDDETKKLLKKFTYETRLTTRDFCVKLIDNINNNFIKNTSFSSEVKNSNWYFLVWDKDPSVQAMLNMLDIIHVNFKNIKDNFWEKLTNPDKPIIYFYFLPLKEFKLTDELYIKMNARGKPLTKFENFKALLSSRIDENSKVKLDNVWLDFFWHKLKEKKHPEDAENTFYNLFENLSLILLAESDFIITKEIMDEFDLIKLWYDTDKKDKIFSENNLNNLIKFLDFVTTFQKYSTLDGYYKVNDLIDNMLKPFKDVTYSERVWFYSLWIFLTKNNFKVDDSKNIESYKDWMRVCYNLIFNTRIEEADRFQYTIKSLQKISDGIKKIYEYLCDKDEKFYNESKISFAKEQFNEEIIKAKLINKDSQWKDEILKVEQHPYFDGQIGFILEMSKDEKNDYNLDAFKKYSKILSEIFNSQVNSQNNQNNQSKDFLFERALLCYGDYLPAKGSNYTFCNYNTSLREKMENWRKVFNDSNKRVFLKQLLDNLINKINGEININTIKKELENIINGKLSEIEDWRFFIIDEKELINYCIQRQIRFISDNEIYLLKKTQMNGEHTELFTYYLFHKLKTENANSISYEFSNETGYMPYIKIKNLAIKLHRNENHQIKGLIIEFTDNSSINNANSYSVFSRKSYVIQDNGKIYIKIDKESVLNFINDISNILKGIN